LNRITKKLRMLRLRFSIFNHQTQMKMATAKKAAKKAVKPAKKVAAKKVAPKKAAKKVAAPKKGLL
jgi:hypothetical protein